MRTPNKKIGISSKWEYLPVNTEIMLPACTKNAVRPTTGSFPARMAALPAVLPGKVHESDVTKPALLEELHRILRSIAHDLRTPLATIMNCVEILGEKVDTDRPQVLEQMRRSAERMSELIGGMLERAREGADIPRTKWIDMPRLLERVRNEVEQSQPIGSHDGRIKLLNAPWIPGDPMKVAQVFTNLFSNAVKYSRKAPQPLISVEGHVLGNEIVYTVTDNGIGIGPDNIDDLFKPFQRLNNALDYEGNGVGLSIVKEIIQGMKGRVWVNSDPGVETRFNLAFPKVPGAADQV